MRRGTLTNKTIVIIKIVSACVMWFVSSLFFFANINILLDDITQLSWLSPLPILFFLALLAVLAYIGFLAGRIEDKRLFLADKFDVWYKIIFSLVLIYINIRSVIVNLEVPALILVLSVASGLVTWFTPRLQMHDNQEF